MHCFRRPQSFDGRDLVAIVHQRQVQAGKHTLAVHVHCAGAALPVITTFLGSSKRHCFADAGTYAATKLAATPLPEVKRNWRRFGCGDVLSSSCILVRLTGISRYEMSGRFATSLLIQLAQGRIVRIARCRVAIEKFWPRCVKWSIKADAFR